MNYRRAFPKKFLRSADIEPGHDIVVTIKECGLEKVGREDEEGETKLVLHFEELEAGLACNATNAEIIAGFYGDETDEWCGKRITLYHNPNVKFGGKKVGGICVRETKPTSAPPPPAAHSSTKPVVEGWSLQQALMAAEEVGMTKEELRKLLQDAGHAGWNPKLTGWLQSVLADMAPPADDETERF